MMHGKLVISLLREAELYPPAGETERLSKADLWRVAIDYLLLWRCELVVDLVDWCLPVCDMFMTMSWRKIDSLSDKLVIV